MFPDPISCNEKCNVLPSKGKKRWKNPLIPGSWNMWCTICLITTHLILETINLNQLQVAVIWRWCSHGLCMPTCKNMPLDTYKLLSVKNPVLRRKIAVTYVTMSVIVCSDFMKFGYCNFCFYSSLDYVYLILGNMYAKAYSWPRMFNWMWLEPSKILLKDYGA